MQLSHATGPDKHKREYRQQITEVCRKPSLRTHQHQNTERRKEHQPIHIPASGERQSPGTVVSFVLIILNFQNTVRGFTSPARQSDRFIAPCLLAHPRRNTRQHLCQPKLTSAMQNYTCANRRCWRIQQTCMAAFLRSQMNFNLQLGDHDPGVASSGANRGCSESNPPQGVIYPHFPTQTIAIYEALYRSATWEILEA